MPPPKSFTALLSLLLILFLLTSCQSHDDLCLGHKTITADIPTRDGKATLHTEIQVPETLDRSFPTVLERTPYGAAQIVKAGFCSKFTHDCYACVVQDQRGRFGSTGPYSFWGTDHDDAADTIKWIANQTWSDNNILIDGTSANAIAAFMGDASQTAADFIKAQYTVVGTASLYPTAFQNGAFRESLFGGWLKAIGEPNYVRTVLEHESLDVFWDNRTLDGHWQYTSGIPLITVAGWWDIFQKHSILAFEDALSANAAAFLVMGPFGHCGTGGQVHFPNNKTDVDEKLRKAAYSGQSLADFRRINFYVQGPDGGTTGGHWVSTDTWPDTTPKSLYLSRDGGLLASPPPNDTASFVYDPSNPVPTLGGNNLLIECGPFDQTPVTQGRSDVMLFQTVRCVDPP